MSRTSPGDAVAEAPPRGVRSPLRGAVVPVHERVVEGVLLLCGAASVLTTVGIVAVLAAETVGFFREVGLSAFFLDTEWTPLFAEPHFGIWPLVAGTLLTSALAIAVAVPLGLLAAIYLAELSPARLRRVLKPMLELLAGVPTIVYGYFALVFVTPLLQRVVPSLSGFNALAPGIVMGVMITPMISSLSEEALRAVPVGVREAAHGLGATRLSTLFRVVLPGAASGVTASVILAASRAVGETMIVAIAAGQQPRLTLDPRVPVETMTTYIVQISLGDVPAGTLGYRTLFAVGASLFVLTLVMNSVSLRLVRRLGVVR